MRATLERLSHLTTARRTAWLCLVVAALLTGVVMAFAPAEGGRTAPETLPDDADSVLAAQRLEEFPGGDVVPAIAVVAREGGLTESDRAWVGEVQAQWARTLDLDGAEALGRPVPSSDGAALLVTLPVPAELSGLDLNDKIKELRADADDAPDGLTVQLTGGAAFAADISAAFEGADLRLLLATAGVVALLLVLTYRSPVLWLVPLLVVGIADRVAALLTERVGLWLGAALDGSTSGITSVLVFGAGANYALLLVSRYREELRRHERPREALAAAFRGAVPAILASNVTVVLALLVLLLSVQPNSRSLGLSAAVGLLVALVFGIFVLPAALSCFGRGLFWPFVPRFDPDAAEAPPGAWLRLARAVVRRAPLVLAAGILALAALGTGTLGIDLGLSRTDQFRVAAESVDGLETLSEHFPSGSSDPVRVVVAADALDPSVAALDGLDGVERVTPAGTSGDWGLALVTLDDPPGSPASLATVENIRAELDDVDGAEALVGGTVAEDLDARDAAERDLRVIVPLIVLVVLAVLVVLLRSLLAPVLLLGVNLVSTLAALGAGSWVSRHVFDFPALDRDTPLYVFLFLVAIGIDYTIFLVVRAREEGARLGTVRGMEESVGHTGGVITSAGIVLASVFVVLGVLPLITLTQIGIIVGLGILLDTFVVRPLVVPALFAVVGERIWWPGRLAEREA